MFENYSKCRIWISEFWHFPPIFVLLKLTCLLTLFDRKLQVFKNSPKWTMFGIFNSLLSTQNVNVARFARNVEWDFFCDFQTLWYDRLFWIILGCCVYCCYPCAVYRDAEDLNKSGVLYGFLACLFPCIPTFLLRGETREKYGIEVKMHIIFIFTNSQHDDKFSLVL